MYIVKDIGVLCRFTTFGLFKPTDWPISSAMATLLTSV